MREYLGWKYGSHYEGSKIMFDLEPDKYYDMPKSFFKYYALSKNSVDALINLYVYASHPAQLNDPFDCDMKLAKIEDEENAKLLWGSLYDEVRQFCEDEESLYEYSTNLFSTLIFRKWGVLSLTDSCDNMKIWSLYAQNTGFCLEWDINQFAFDYKGPFPIHYVPSDNLREASSKNYNVPTLALIQSNVKRDWWKDENEWRLMIQNPKGVDMRTYGPDADRFNQFSDIHDRKFKYPIKALKSITLGIGFFNGCGERKQIIAKNPYEIQVCYESECIETKLLDFLDRIKTFVRVQQMFKIGLNYFIKTIVVLKMDKLKYQIIEIA